MKVEEKRRKGRREEKEYFAGVLMTTNQRFFETKCTKNYPFTT